MCLKNFFSPRQDMNEYIFHIMRTNVYIQPPEEKKRNAVGMTIPILQGVGKIAKWLWEHLLDLFFFIFQPFA